MMDRSMEWAQALSEAAAQLSERVILYLPSILGGVFLLIIGWFAARLSRALAVRGATIVDRWLVRVPGADTGRVRLPDTSVTILGSLVFWIVLLIFITAATQILGLDTFTAWLARVVDYLPTLIAGGLIVLAGVLLSRLAREIVEAATATADEQQRRLLGRATQTVILATAMLVGADQIGIKVTFLVVIAGTLAGAVVFAVGLAVSLGARQYVANLIGSHYLRQTYRAGQTVRVGGVEGKILDITPTALVLETAEGRASLPAKAFNEDTIVVLVGNQRHG